MAIITISRQFGAGGKTLALKVAEKLQYHVAHEQIIEKMAEMGELTPEGIRNFEVEFDYGSAADIARLAPKSFISRILDPQRKYMDAQHYIQLLHQIVPQIVEKGNTVVLGRGAQFILKDHKDTYHILLVADESGHVAGVGIDDGRRRWHEGLDVEASPSATPVAFGDQRMLVPIADGTLLDLPIPQPPEDEAGEVEE